MIFDSHYHILVLLATFVCLLYIRLARAITYSGGIPRVGGSGVIGYIATALRWTLDAPSIIIQGKTHYPGRPFVIPTLAGPVFFLGPEHLDTIRSGNDDIFNEPMAVSDDLQLPYTMDAHQMENPYQATVLRTDVNRAIPLYIPEILEESVLAMDEIIGTPALDAPRSLPVFHTMTHLIARISNRVIFGTQLCRNRDFLHSIVHFAETVTVIAPFVHWSPVLLRRAVYFVLSMILGGKGKALKFIVPFLSKYKQERGSREENYTVAEFLMGAAPPHETTEGLAVRLLNINFGSIHTSSIFITQTLFELALLPQQDMDSIRDEINAALESEGGWNKLSLLKFRKIDSALREIGRVYGLMQFALPRVALLGYDLPDGTTIPPGHRIAIDVKAIHFDPAIYPDPDRCDLFRFAKLRELEGTDSKYGFATLDSHYLPFGAGRHACAGRFFAAMELKIMLAHILLKYDIKFSSGTERPANITFNGAIIPDTKAEMIFIPRTR